MIIRVLIITTICLLLGTDIKHYENEKNQSKIILNSKNNLKKRASQEIITKNKNKFNQMKRGKLKLNNIDQDINKNMKKETKTIGNINKFDSSLENLYNKMSTKEDLLIFQPEIKNYLENKKYDVSVKLNPSVICNNFEKTREKICTSECLKNNMQLRKQIGNIESKVEEINDNDIKAINNMNKIEDKMIKLFSDINNPKPKEAN